jgi:hypothetical protein
MEATTNGGRNHKVLCYLLIVRKIDGLIHLSVFLDFKVERQARMTFLLRLKYSKGDKTKL